MSGSPRKPFAILRKALQRSRSSTPTRDQRSSTISNAPSDAAGNTTSRSPVAGQHEATSVTATTYSTSESKAFNKNVNLLAQKAKSLLQITHSITKRIEPLTDGTMAKLPFGIFNILIEAFETYEGNNEKAEKCLDQIMRRLQIVGDSVALGNGDPGEEIQATWEEFKRNLLQTQQELESFKGAGTWTKIWTMDQATQKITDFVVDIDEYTKTFSLQITVAIQKDTSYTRRKIEMLHMEQWPISHAAWYAADAGSGISKRGCTPETRVDIIQRVRDWVMDTSDDSPPVFWLRGMAGMGKSTIAYSICEYFDNPDGEHHLGASFFCSRQTENLRVRKYIIPTVAQQLADYSISFADALSGVKSHVPHIVEKQIAELLIKPWQNSRKKHLPERLPVLVVIDALDEIGDSQGSRLIEALITGLNQAGTAMHGIKFFITSRPDPSIVSTCKQLKVEASFILEDVEPTMAINDVRRFLAEELKVFNGKEEESLDIIARQSQGVFIYASTAVRYILPKGQQLSLKQMRARLIAIAGDSPAPNHLGTAELLVDTLYKQVVNEALGDSGTDAFELRRQVLDTVAISQQPISVATISQLLSVDDENGDLEAVANAIGALHAVASISTKDGCVYIYHKTFLDFLLDPGRAGEQLVCQASSQHTHIAKHCFAIMKSSLQFNICKLTSSFLLDSEVSNLQHTVEEKFNEAVQYCCIFWADHLSNVTERMELGLLVDLLHEFGKERALFWIEAMNLLQRGRRSYEAIKKVHIWVSKERTSTKALVVTLAAIERVAKTFTESPARLSTPHLYISSLATEFATGNVPNEWRKQFSRLPYVQCEGVSNHGGGMNSISVGSEVNAVAFLVDSSRIVAGSHDKTVSIWDAHTGVKLQTLEGHTGSVYSVAIQHDGSHVVSGSSDNTARIWDANTGMTLHILEGHTDYVCSVAFSNDGSRIVSGGDDERICLWTANTGVNLWTLEDGMGNVRAVAFSKDDSLIVSGSSDTVCIWDASTGENLQILEGHTDSVYSVAFSNDGSLIVSGSLDETARIWDANTGDTLHILDDFLECVMSVAFSHDDSRVVSGSMNRSVLTWDTKTGECLQEFEGHTDWVCSVAFSSDDSRIVSGSSDQTIRIWDTHTTGNVEPLEGHITGVTSVAFSDDDSFIVSGAEDGDIYIWDVEAGVTSQLLEGHKGSILSLAFCVSDSRIISGANDGVYLWNADTGEQVHKFKFKGHLSSIAFSTINSQIVYVGSKDKTMRIWDENAKTLAILESDTSQVECVAFSHDGSYIASGLKDGTIRIWDAKMGAAVKILKGHTNCVDAVAFSNDGSRIVSSSFDKTVVWNVKTETKLQTLEGDTSYIRFVAFSNDGSLIICASFADTVRIWDANNGVHLQTLVGHTDSVLSFSFSSDDSRIISGSKDNTIRIWDATGVKFGAEHAHPGGLRSKNTLHHNSSRAGSDQFDNAANIRDVNSGANAEPLDDLKHNVAPLHNFTFSEGESGWLFTPSRPGCRIMWLPPPLQETLPIYPCLDILSWFGKTWVTYEHDAIGPEWMNCYNPSA